MRSAVGSAGWEDLMNQEPINDREQQLVRHRRRDLESRVRAELMGGRRHIFEPGMKENRRSHGLRHQAVPDDGPKSQLQERAISLDHRPGRHSPEPLETAARHPNVHLLGQMRTLDGYLAAWLAR